MHIIHTEEMKQLYRKLWAGYDYLEDHPDDPAFARKEGGWLAWLARYEALCDAQEKEQAA